MSPAAATVKLPLKTPLKSKSVPTPAWKPLPCAGIVPVKAPLLSVVTLVNGCVVTPTPEVLPGTVPAGGLKLMVGKYWLKTGACVGCALKTPEPLEVKNRPSTVVVEMVWTGVTQLTLEPFD